MINGGNAAKGMLGGAKFNVGDKVVSKSAPDGGVGTVEKANTIKAGGILYECRADYSILRKVTSNRLLWYNLFETEVISTVHPEEN